jgi:uncharacterized LabA/DUF88 family protein
MFVDHANFDSSWREVSKPRARLDWAKLPAIILARLAEMDYLKSSEMEHRGITVYASIHPQPSQADLRYEHWLRFELDQLPGYTVKFATRQLQTGRCNEGHATSQFVEKGVDTKIACDMLASAIRDGYDVGVIMSNDADLIPSIECVQDVLDRRFVHVGFGKPGQYIRSAAWGHIKLDDVIEDLTVEAKVKAVPASAA